MFGHRPSGKGLLVCAALTFAGFSVFAGSRPKIEIPPARDDGAWKNYYNRQAGYCVDYPSHWVSGEAFEGSGFFLLPAPNRHSSSLAEIDGAVLPEGLRPEAALPGNAASFTLIEEAQLHVEHLGKFGLAEQPKLVEQHDTLLFGSPALFTEDSYYDPQNHQAMVDEIVFANHAGMLYRLELASRADELDRFEPVFQRLVGSFRFNCVAHALPRSFGDSHGRKDREASLAGPLAIYPHPVAR